MHPKALLDAAAELVKLVLTFEHPADATVARYFREHRSLGSRERATLAGTAYNVLRLKLRFEHFAPSGSGPRERRLAILGFDAPRDFLYGAINNTEQAWLEQCDAVRTEDLLDRHRYNLPDWLADRLRAQLGADFAALATSLNELAPLDVRVNALTDKREAVRKELKAAGIVSTLTPFSPWGLRLDGKPVLAKLPLHERGALEVQDEGSQLLALLLDAKRGEMVVDFCAGAGGKTLAIGAAMRNTGRLYAFDTSGHRLDALKPRLARSGLSNVHPAAIAHERDDRVKRLAGKIDRVLVDAPCSSLGTLRRHPDLKWRQTAATVAEYATLQSAILTSAARLVKPGGRLVYATCSLLPDENEAVAAGFDAALAREFDPMDAGEILSNLKVDGAAGLCAGGETGSRYLRLWPHRHQTDGFFAAVWQRR